MLQGPSRNVLRLKSTSLIVLFHTRIRYKCGTEKKLYYFFVFRGRSAKSKSGIARMSTVTGEDVRPRRTPATLVVPRRVRFRFANATSSLTSARRRTADLRATRRSQTGHGGLGLGQQPAQLGHAFTVPAGRLHAFLVEGARARSVGQRAVVAGPGVP